MTTTIALIDIYIILYVPDYMPTYLHYDTDIMIHF